MKPSNNLENKTLSETYWRVQLVCMNVETHSSLESLSIRTKGLWWIKVCYDNFTILVYNFGLSDTKDNTSGPINRGGIVDLPLLRTLLAFYQMSGEHSFYEVMGSFALVAYVSLPASKTLLEQLLGWLNFSLDSADFFCRYKRKN